VWILGSLALAGPTWEREPAPFGEETAALVIVLKVTPTMLASDIQPTRLARANHKIRDLLAQRPGGRSALIAYSGSAHVVMPLTSDARIIEQFAGELSPDIMPLEGDVVAEAIELAKATLAASELPGSIVLLADEIAANQLDILSMQHAGSDPETHILAMAAGPDAPVSLDGPPAPALDEVTMQQAARNAGGSLVRLTADEGDVARLSRLAASSVASVSVGEGETWRDGGYYLLPVLALLVLLGFRPGWMVRYQ
jgi:Ca-activated chloride channel family protein